ncbi:hypothetical protein COW46_00190 [Candidatus Gracilibacteria bacterium CG17_big_fil_post_rev_8_21_14_2_50_48_13]|nr:MAG: hypothetical protein COW46_00190 [Candidatus Gracilibacteria bacterium CG17_big_fil_post_rev_8_21_14_2_50_48_13]
MHFSRIVLRLLASLGLLHLVSLSFAYAVDCPALRISDNPANLQGQEIMSNTAPLEFAVRLSWENSSDFTPTRTSIYRRSKDTLFTKIGQTTSSSPNFYIDKTIAKSSPAYIYAVQSEYTCGGTLWSEPVTIATPRRSMDTTPPLIQIVFPGPASELRGSDDIFVYVRDSESGVAEKTIKIKAGTTSLPAGTNLGTTQFALFKIPASSLPTQLTDFKVTANNGADLTAERSVKVMKVDPTSSALQWSSPTSGSGIDPRLPTKLSWSKPADTESTGDNILLDYSTNFGSDWFPLTEKEITSASMTPTEVIKGIKNAGVVWFRLGYQAPDGKIYGRKILPLFMSLTTVTVTSPANFLAQPTGALSFTDALKNTKVTFTKETPGVDSKDLTKMTLEDQKMVLALRPGFYALEEFMDSFLLPPTTMGKVLQISPGDSETTIAAYPNAFFRNDRQALSSEGEAVISNSYFPKAFTDAYAAYDKKMAVEAVATENVTKEPTPEPLFLRLIRCSTTECQSTPYEGMNPMTFIWDKDANSFQNATGSGQVVTPSPIYFGKVTLTTNPISVHIPEEYFDTFTWTSDETFQAKKISPEGIQWKFPERFIRSLQASTGFVKVSYALPTGKSCTQYLFERTDALGNQALVPTLCATNTIVGVLLPFTQTDIEITSVTRDFAILEGNDWFVPYMNQFQLWNMLVKESDITLPHEEITRGELAYLLHKAFQYPVGAYSSGKQTFKDLSANHPFAPYLLGMVAYNIMSGDKSLETIRPDAPVNRAEALKMIMTAAHLSQTELSPRLATQSIPNFIDVPSDAWFAPYINRAAQLGMISGYLIQGKQVFKPDNHVSRAEAVKIIYSSLEKKALE